MKRLAWELVKSSPLDLSPIGIPKCYVLVPESDDESIELRKDFEAQGVRDRMSFITNGINGRLDMPTEIRWEQDGAVPVTITVIAEGQIIPAWFWLIECDDESNRRFAWWSTQRSPDTCIPWC